MALGRGLKALLPDDFIENNSEENLEFRKLPIDSIFPNEEQPRNLFDDEKLNELANSIKQYGIIEPLIVKEEDRKFYIIAGERRWRAAKIAGLEEVPVIINNSEHDKALTIIENLQREDLNVIELAHGYKQLMEQNSLTQEQLSEVLNITRSSVSNVTRLLKLPESIQKDIYYDRISYGAGRALLGLDDENAQLDMAKTIIENNLSVRDVEKLIKKSQNNSKKKIKKKENNAFISAIEENLSEFFSSKVNIKENRNKGKIEISFDSLEKLNDILEVLGLKEDV